MPSLDTVDRFGPLTKGAVKAFQRDSGITADGSVGPQTRQKMSAALLLKVIPPDVAAKTPCVEPGSKLPQAEEPEKDEPSKDVTTPSGESSKNKPAKGPDAGTSCVGSIYRSDPIYLDPEIASSASEDALNLFKEEDYYFYLQDDAQREIYRNIVNRLREFSAGQVMPVVGSIVLRQVLSKVNPACAWNYPLDEVDNGKTGSRQVDLTWESAGRLLQMAQVTTGVIDPATSSLLASVGSSKTRYIVPRRAMGISEQGMTMPVDASSIGRRVDFLATDQSMEHAEMIAAEVVSNQGPENNQDQYKVRVIGRQGTEPKSTSSYWADPFLRKFHGFKKGSTVFLNRPDNRQGTGGFPAPTGAYRIWPKS